MSKSSTASVFPASIHLETTERLFEHILVAVDFSAASRRALEEAIAIAECYGSKIFLVHAASQVIYGTGLEPIPLVPIGIELEAAQSNMADLIRSTPALQSIPHSQLVAYSPILGLIEEVVEDEAIDLVVTGSRGFGGLERLALGSVAESILSSVRCPVLIVGPSCAVAQAPFHNILFATNLETTGLRAAQFASSLAERFHSPLTMLHVVEEGTRSHRVAPELVNETAQRELDRLLPSDLSSYTAATLRVEHGSASDLVPAVATSIKASLIVTGFGDSSILRDHAPWSTLSHIIRRAPCPVLAIRRHL